MQLLLTIKNRLRRNGNRQNAYIVNEDNENGEDDKDHEDDKDDEDDEDVVTML